MIIVGVFIKSSYKIVNNTIILLLLFTALLVFQQQNEFTKIFNQNYIIDNFSTFMKMITILSCVAVLIISNDYIKNAGLNKFEYPIFHSY